MRFENVRQILIKYAASNLLFYFKRLRKNLQFSKKKNKSYTVENKIYIF